MSAPVVRDDVKFFQRFLQLDGLYDGDIDGKWGPITEEGARQFEKASDTIRTETRTFDVRSETNIRSLSLKAQREARRCLDRLLTAGFNARVISGTRTYAEQDALFRKGRFGNPGPVVTKARGGQSNHNFGIAWDIGLFSANGTYLTATKPYKEASAAGKSEFLEWGGDWVKFPDPPHYQLKIQVTLVQMQKLFESGNGAKAFA
jgi:peptidoglycan L-alanyl-D-glutamate endopeptidase CwlK